MDNQLPGILDRYIPNPCNAEDLDVIAEFIMNGGLQALPRSLLCTALKIATLSDQSFVGKSSKKNSTKKKGREGGVIKMLG